MKFIHFQRVGLAALLSGGLAWAAPVNLAPDAVTGATQGYNVYEGEMACLTDGMTPENSDASATLVWPNKGNLVFQFGEAVAVAGVRLYVGDDAGAYQVRAYAGARLNEDGQTDAAQASLVADVFDAAFATDTWVELPFPAAVLTDYIEVDTQQGAIFYEIQIIAAAPTQIPTPSWGQVKAEFGGKTGDAP